MSLHHFIQTLEQQGELVRIGQFVDPVLEIAEVTDRCCKQPGGGKALLFENTGTPFPVLTNAMGSERRICTALGVAQLDEAAAHIRRSEPIALISTGKAVPVFSKSKALPPPGCLQKRSVISAISSTGSTNCLILISSSCCSSNRIKRFINDDFIACKCSERKC